ncbi:uncharacterized protein [Watersipora subatra]|uniref:uncharacterized protein n=1 Tax=Watersipora subatra TaxID=2589382 RepID=UPI00355B511B
MATFLPKTTNECSVKCGYCLEEQLVDPRVLPCKHANCYPCLVGNFNTNRIVRCGECKKVFDMTLSRLPAAPKREDNSHICDVCLEKGTADELAVSYCASCNRRMCVKHSEFHQEFHPLHRYIFGIEEYKHSCKRLETRNCERHEAQPATMGCSACYQILCASCMDGTNLCAPGLAHQPVILEELVQLLKVEKDEAKAMAQAKEEKLSELLKSSTRVFSEFERKTADMLELLHMTRDEQLTELRRKYDELERELIEERRRSKEQLVEFMERDIGVRMTDINTLLLLQDVRFNDSHPAVVVNSFAETTKEIRSFIDEDFPSLVLDNQKKLSVLADNPAIELKLVQDANIRVGLLPPLTCPKLKATVEAPRSIYSVCHQDGFAYLGAGTTVYKIDASGDSVTAFLATTGLPMGLCIHRNMMYILLDSCEVAVYNIETGSMNSWKHFDNPVSYGNKLVVTGNKVIIPNRLKKCLSIYSLLGKVIKHIACPQNGKWTNMALCAPDAKSVVVSSAGTSSVFRVHLETGEVMWTSTDVVEPGCIACYQEEYILVMPLASRQMELYILETSTGRCCQKLVGSKILKTSIICDLLITEKTMIIPTQDGEVSFYKMKSDQ